MTGGRADRAGDIAGLLVGCLRSAGEPNPPEQVLRAARHAEPVAVMTAAEHHGLGPALYSILAGSPDIPAATIQALEHAYQAHWQIQLLALGDLAELASVLDDVVPWAVVKGPVLAETIYRDGFPRAYVDLDILVNRSSLPLVLEAVEAAGGQLSDRNWAMARPDVLGELTLTLRHGTTLDLHWHLINEAHVRRAFSVSTTKLLSRVRRVPLNGTPTPTLDSEDTLLHVATHAVLNGGLRLLWFKDVQQIVLNDPPDWDVLIARARSSRLSLVLAIMLERTERILPMELPEGVLDALAPRHGWRASVRLADRVRPPERSSGRQLTGRTLVASTRRSTAASAVALAGSVVHDVMGSVLTDSGHPWRSRLGHHPSAQSAALQGLPESGELDRDEILRRIAAVSQSPHDP